MDQVAANIRKLLGMELLEYEDKNALAGTIKQRAKERITLLQETLEIIEGTDKE